MVKSRDDNTCQVCGKRKLARNLHAHHLESYSDNPELRTVLSNGISLCGDCHEKFHLKYNKGGNTKEQFNEFLKNNKKNNVIKSKVFKQKRFKIKHG